MRDHWSSTTTAAGVANGTTIEDDELERFGDDQLVGQYVRLTSGSSTLEVARITDSAQSTGVITVSPPFSAQVATSVTYEIHKYDPATKFEALDAARTELAADLFQLIYDETITLDGVNRTYPIPSAMRSGPIVALLEAPIAVEHQGNFIQDPRGDSTANWTAASATATTVSKTTLMNKLVPKYDETCTKIAVATATNGTYKQPVASMTNSITAALAAGQQMTFGAWVYCQTANRVTLTFEDDSGETSSSLHGGAGWEFLSLSKDIVSANATTLTVGFDVTNDTGAVDFFWNRAWLTFGPSIPEQYSSRISVAVRRDDTTQTLTLTNQYPRGRQLRLIGKDVLSALGTVAASQITNTMEVDAKQADLLYAKAAEILFGWDGLNADNIPEIGARIQLVNGRRGKLRSQWGVVAPQRGVRNPYRG
jgi:hypothetical protein